jgi:hypothetical protein
MKMNRKILYGYHILDGVMTIQPQEAEVVKRIFTDYISGTSQREITDALNADGVIYDPNGAVNWSTRTISSLLRNRHYIGADGYPALLDSETFLAAQKHLRNRRTFRTRPILRLQDKLYCQNCGGRLKQTYGSGDIRPDTLYLRCKQCNSKAAIPDDELLAVIKEQAAEYVPLPPTPPTAAYSPSGEVVRLTNAINRGLERPEQPEEVVSLILQGISARYECIPSENPPIDLLRIIDEGQLEKAVQSIAISAGNEPTVTFKR